MIELMIVVAILGIMAAIAVPNYMKMTCRAQQSEAKANGATLVRMLSNHKEEMTLLPNGTHRPAGFVFDLRCNGVESGDNFLGFGVKGDARRYSYRVTKTGVGTSAWTLVMQGCHGAVRGDTWMSTSATGQLRNAANACK